MRYLMRVLFLTPLLALNACGGGGDGDEDVAPLSAIELGDEFVLGYGKTAVVGVLTLDFTAIEDSRCGANSPAVCVWEGNAFILLSASDRRDTYVLTHNSNPKFPTSAYFAGHDIHLRRLE